MKANFSKNQCRIYSPHNQLLAQAPRVGNLYILDNHAAQETALSVLSTKQLDLWHCRLGHLGEKNLKRLLENQGEKISSNSHLTFCE